MIACMMGNKEIASILLDNRVNVNSREYIFLFCVMFSYEGNTPLHYACIRNHEEVVKLLITAGAKPQLCNLDKRSAICYTNNSTIQRIIITGYMFPFSVIAVEIVFRISMVLLSLLMFVRHLIN